MVDERTRTVLSDLRRQAPPPDRPLRILSLDGGGIRGLIPARVLEELERLTARRIWECFDLVAGTSTGGILALGLTVPGKGGHACWKAASLVDMYRHDGSRIFKRSLWRLLGGKLVVAKYPVDGLEQELRERVGDALVGDALTEVLLTSWDLVRNRPLYFTRSSLGADVAMRDAARATSAAPTYFRPKPLGEHLLVDGGVFANDPALLGWQAMRPPGDEGPPPPPAIVVSIGTGQLPVPDPRRRHLWGLIPWAQPLLELLLNAPSELAQVELETAGAAGAFEYHRLEPSLGDASPHMDDTSPANIAALDAVADTLIAEHLQELQAIAARL